ARGVGLYLWHIPLVATVTGIAWGIGMDAEPFSLVWWAAHLLGLAIVVTGGWWLAGRAGRADGWLTGTFTDRLAARLTATPRAGAGPAGCRGAPPAAAGAGRAAGWGAGPCGPAA